MTEPVEGAATYAAAGVDIEAGELAVDLIKSRLRSTRPEVVGGLGGFAGIEFVDLTMREDALFYGNALERHTRPMNGDR